MQHGRYLIPTIPIFVLYGVAGGTIALRRARALLRPALAAGLITGFALFALLGALAYARNIAWIECEMGSSARWVAAHSAPGTLIAAHDIGRLGYLTQRPLLDFAGLISPKPSRLSATSVPCSTWRSGAGRGTSLPLPIGIPPWPRTRASPRASPRPAPPWATQASSP